MFIISWAHGWTERFQHLVMEVGLGKVGVVRMAEASRLARNDSDWYRLIEICGLTRTLIADENVVYNPREPNRRLLLEMKRTLSEAELSPRARGCTRDAGTKPAKVSCSLCCPWAWVVRMEIGNRLRMLKYGNDWVMSSNTFAPRSGAECGARSKTGWIGSRTPRTSRKITWKN
jgi:hypothetical protein